MTATEKARMLRCAASFVAAAYMKSTPHSSGLARLACGLFPKPSPFEAISDSHEGVNR